MNYELADFTCLGDTALRQVVVSIDASGGLIDALTVLVEKMQRCAGDFRSLGKDWRRLGRRPRGKRARRASFAARRRGLRNAP
jgi:hypothetical protein